MKLGVVLHQNEIGANPADLRSFAQTAESLGYDYILSYDHVLGANPDRPGGLSGPYTHLDTFHEPLTLYSYLAALTTTIELVTGIIILPQRQTVLVAKQAAQVDVLSGGRLRLGVGLGWNTVEYTALGANFHDRGKRFEDQIALLRALWTQPLVTWDSPYHQVPDAGLNPLPVQRPIPLWIGGHADAAINRAAHIADGWMPSSVPLETLRQLVAKLHAALDQAGRPRENFGLDVRIGMNYCPPEQWAKEADGIRELGATHIGISTLKMGFTHLDQHLEAMHRFKQIVG